MTLRRWAVLALVIAALAIVAVLGWCFRPGPTPPPPPRVVHDTVVLHDRPSGEKPTVGERLTTHGVPPVRVVTAGAPDTTRVRAFARKVFEAESLRAVLTALRDSGQQATADSVARETPPPVLPPVAGRYDGRRLDLWLSRSDGSVMQASAALRPRWSFRAGQGDLTDSVPAFTQDRWWLRMGRQTVKCAPVTGVGAGLGALSDRDDRVGKAVLGGLLALGACLAGGG